MSSLFSRWILFSLSNGLIDSTATDSIGSNRWFFDDFIGWIGREIYHFAEVTEISAGGSDFLSNDEQGWVKSPGLKVILPIVAEGVWPLSGQLAKRAECVVNGADWD